MEHVTSWTAPVAPTPVRAHVAVPGSKSLTNRALVLAALADGPSTIHGALRSRDTELMIGALQALGTRIDGAAAASETTLHVTPGELRGATVDCGLAGTVMRFVPPVAALAVGRSEFDGDPEARVRPQGTMLDALRAAGVSVAGSALPFVVDGIGRVPGGDVSLDASASSQFVSGMLLAAARFDSGVTVRHTGAAAVPSQPHIDMTLEMLRAAGVNAGSPEPGLWRVEPGAIAGRDWVIEPDLSNATPFLAAAAATGGEVSVPLWPLSTTQAGDAFREIVAEMGAEVSLTADSATPGAGTLTVRGRQLRGIDCDLGEVGELTPTIAALAALAEGPTRLRGIGHLRGHETDRLAALATELGARGVAVTELPDGLAIEPRPVAQLQGGAWRAYADHRMATAGAIIGLRLPGVEVDDIDCTSKTLPDFAGMWTTMLAGR